MLDRLQSINPIIPISILFWIVSGLLYLRYDVVIMGDAFRYLEYAKNLKQGFYFDPHNFWYIGYVIFIFIVKLISGKAIAIVIAQYVLNYLAILSLYQTSILLFSNKRSALLASIIYILFIDLMMWHSFILCESFYVSMLCFSFFGLVKLRQGSRSFIQYILVGLIIMITLISKPTGIALLIALGVWALYKIFLIIKSKIWKVTLFTLLSIGTLLLANRMLATYTIIENDYRTGEIIYGITNLTHVEGYEHLRVEPPSDITFPNPSLPPLIEIGSFILNNPAYWLELFLKKVFFLLSHVRPYWSFYHNFYTISILLPLYFFTGRLIMKKSFPMDFSAFSISYFTAHTAIVGLATVDWDGRFLLPFLPLIFIFGSESLVDFWEKKFLKPTS